MWRPYLYIIPTGKQCHDSGQTSCTSQQLVAVHIHPCTSQAHRLSGVCASALSDWTVLTLQTAQADQVKSGRLWVSRGWDLPLCQGKVLHCLSLAQALCAEERPPGDVGRSRPSTCTSCLKRTQILPSKLKAAFRNTELINNTVPMHIICRSEVLGIFTCLPTYPCRSSYKFCNVLHLPTTGNYLWYLRWFDYHDTALLVITILQGSIYGQIYAKRSEIYFLCCCTSRKK